MYNIFYFHSDINHKQLVMALLFGNDSLYGLESLGIIRIRVTSELAERFKGFNEEYYICRKEISLWCLK